MSTHLWGAVALLSTVMVVVMGIIGALLRTSAPAAEAPNFYAMVLATPQTHVWLWVLALLYYFANRMSSCCRWLFSTK